MGETELPPPAAPADDADWRRGFGQLWDVFLALAFGAGLYDAAQRGWLSGPRFAWLVALALACLTAHRWFWAPVRRGYGAWPPAYRDVLLLVAVELVLVIALLPASPWFAWPLLAVMGQVAAALPPRSWLVPMAAVVAVLAQQVGLLDALAGRRWADAVGLSAALAWLVAIFLYIRQHFDERHARLLLAAERDAARAELARAAPLIARLDELVARDQAARELRDSLQHTLALLNIRLEHATAAELPELRGLVAATLDELRYWPERVPPPPAPPTTPEPPPVPDVPPAPPAPPAPPDWQI